jgi:hypothetical protein
MFLLVFLTVAFASINLMFKGNDKVPSAVLEESDKELPAKESRILEDVGQEVSSDPVQGNFLRLWWLLLL